MCVLFYCFDWPVLFVATGLFELLFAAPGNNAGKIVIVAYMTDRQAFRLQKSGVAFIFLQVIHYQ